MNEPDIAAAALAEVAGGVARQHDRTVTELLIEAGAAELYVHPEPPREPVVVDPDAYLDLHVQVDGKRGVSLRTGETDRAYDVTGQFAVWLPHSCDQWVIADGDRDSALRSIVVLRRQLDEAERMIRETYVDVGTLVDGSLQ